MYAFGVPFSPRSFGFCVSGSVASLLGPARLTDSTPAAIITSFVPARIVSAAIWIAFRLDAQ
jgi:hypothetical protein